MKNKLFFSLMAGFLALAALSSCGGDVDKDLSENLVGHWRGPFIKAGYNADSTEIVLRRQIPIL